VANEITLMPGASAEPDTCGSCKFFERRRNDKYDGMYGNCRFKFPEKTVATGWDIRRLDPALKNAEYTGNEERIKDTDRCDLWKHSGNTYIVQRRIEP
jgi:hypothetical protein